jgi:pyruvate dehydrogenase E1 component beta subunit
LRKLTYSQAINEAFDQCLTEDSNVVLVGEGVPDGVFGMTKDLKTKHESRVFDSPLSENGITGAVIGAAISGMRPVMIHQRQDFMLLSADQLINNAAKWYSTFGKPCPLVVMAVQGRGWGNGPTHTANYQNLFASIPGLKVISPTSPYDAKGMMISAIRDNNPVIMLCHRWLLDTVGEVPAEMHEVPLDRAKVIREGTDVTIVGISYTVLDSLNAAKLAENHNISVEVIDLRSIAPLDIPTIVQSVKKTGRLILADTSHKTGSVGAEIIRQVLEHCFNDLKYQPILLGSKDYPQPTSHYLTKDFYVSSGDILNACLRSLEKAEVEFEIAEPHDVPNKNYSVTF